MKPRKTTWPIRGQQFIRYSDAIALCKRSKCDLKINRHGRMMIRGGVLVVMPDEPYVAPRRRSLR